MPSPRDWPRFLISRQLFPKKYVRIMMMSGWRYQKQMIDISSNNNLLSVSLDCCNTNLLLVLLIVAPRISHYKTPNAGLPHEVIPCFQSCRGLSLPEHEHSAIDGVRLYIVRQGTDPDRRNRVWFPCVSYWVTVYNNRLLVICPDTT